jgi:hypothetical protein
MINEINNIALTDDTTDELETILQSGLGLESWSLVTDEKTSNLNILEFTVSIDYEALDIIHRFSFEFRKHQLIYDYIDKYEPFYTPELENDFERKLVMYICLHVDRRYREVCENRSYIITTMNVISESNYLINEVIYEGWNYYNPDRHIQHMLDSYPISVLANVCQTSYHHAHQIAELTRSLVQYHHRHQIPLDCRFNNILDGDVPLTGDPKSPLNQVELEAIYRYLNVKKNKYVHILLHCLFEFTRYDRLIQNKYMMDDEIIKICQSPWFYLFQYRSIN